MFVTYKIAKKLKELGFDKPCLKSITETGFENDYSILGAENWNKFQFSVSIPLWQQVIDWLREEHKLLIVITHATPKNKYVAIIYKEWNNEVYATLNYPESYSEAREQAILKALELI